MKFNEYEINGKLQENNNKINFKNNICNNVVKQQKTTFLFFSYYQFINDRFSSYYRKDAKCFK